MATIIIRPIADAGHRDLQSGMGGYPADGVYYNKINEITADEDTTYIYPSGSQNTDYYYNMTAVNGYSGQISKVTIKYRAKYITSSTWALPWFKINNNYYDGTQTTLTANYADYSNIFTNNPDTNLPWTWSDVSSLVIGIYLNATGKGVPHGTQLYAEIDYTEIKTPSAFMNSDGKIWILNDAGKIPINT